jgi:hypothetical protein
MPFGATEMMKRESKTLKVLNAEEYGDGGVSEEDLS